MPVTLVDIETKTVERLKAQGLKCQDIDAGADPLGITQPALHVRTTDCLFSDLTNTKQKATIIVSAFLFVKNVQNEKARRHAAYPLAWAVGGLLKGQNLGLDIRPYKLKRIFENTPVEYRDAGVIVYQIDLTTWFAFYPTEEESLDLLRINLEYFLPGDETRDAEDAIDLEE